MQPLPLHPSLPMLVDSHCHLDFKDFSEDFDTVLARAEGEGVRVMQTICTKMTEFPTVLAIAQAHPHIYCSVGIHPHEVETQPPTSAAEIIAHTDHPKVIGIGETGLDFFYEYSPKDQQIRSFRSHIEASRQTGLPLIIHTRNADAQTVEILEEEMKRGKFTGLIHCFTSGPELAEKVLELGLYISISGIVTFKKALELQAIVAKLPLERLLVETDAPYLAPMPKRGQRNEPAFTRHTAAFLANLKGTSYEQVAEATTQNFFTLFNKAKCPT